MRYQILASGSTGNLTLIETDSTRLLVDCGLSGSRVVQKLNEINLSLEDIDALLITHKHADHIKGLKVLSKHIPVYLSDKLYPYVQEKIAKPEHVRLFQSGQGFWLKDLEVFPHPVSHDCIDPVCFVFKLGLDQIGIVTDLGEVTKDLVERFKEVRVLLLEANHDIQMLAQSNRPIKLKNRILSRVGHLSNRSSGRFLAQVYSEKLEEVVLLHLSQDCNHPDIALQTIQEELSLKGIFFDNILVANEEGLLELVPN